MPATDVMIDLETLGTAPGCDVLSIGAVAFDLKTFTVCSTFYVVPNPISGYMLGLKTDNATSVWWGKQTTDAQKVFDERDNSTTTIQSAMHQLSLFIASNSDYRAVRMWSNGADFDLPILAHIYMRLEMAPPWNFYNSRCYRTVKSLMPEIKIEQTNTAHNALADATAQTQHLFRLAQALEKMGVRLYE